MKEAILAEVHKHLNVPGFIEGVLGGALDGALNKLVADTSTPFDDIAKAALYPVLAAEINKMVKAKWDELLAPEAA